jgi:hypothetical protein
LWSHYSNNHEGISILYEFTEEYLNDGKIFVGISDVSYQKDTLTNWFISIANRLPMDFGDLLIELAKIYFTAKSPEWLYEKEVRIISRRPGLLKIEKSFIKQICFGLNTSSEDMELIREITKNYEHSVQFCKIRRSDNDFGIYAEEI